jgi:hypothetical protein
MYSRALLTLEQLRARVPVPALAANGGVLLPRIQRLLQAESSGAPLHPWRLAGTLAAATLILLLGVARRAHGAANPDIPLFGEGMTPPVLLFGEDPRVADLTPPPPIPPGTGPIQFRVVMTCTLTAEGRVMDCPGSSARSGPHAAIHAEVTRALGTRVYEPVTFQGKPIAVRYPFKLILVWPRSQPAPGP